MGSGLVDSSVALLEQDLFSVIFGGGDMQVVQV